MSERDDDSGESFQTVIFSVIVTPCKSGVLYNNCVLCKRFLNLGDSCEEGDGEGNADQERQRFPMTEEVHLRTRAESFSLEARSRHFSRSCGEHGLGSKYRS